MFPSCLTTTCKNGTFWFATFCLKLQSPFLHNFTSVVCVRIGGPTDHPSQAGETWDDEFLACFHPVLPPHAKTGRFSNCFPKCRLFLQLYFVLPFSFPDEALKICQTQLVSLWSSVLCGRLKKIAEKPLVVYGPAHKVHIISEIHKVRFKSQ